MLKHTVLRRERGQTLAVEFTMEVPMNHGPDEPQGWAVDILKAIVGEDTVPAFAIGEMDMTPERPSERPGYIVFRCRATMVWYETPPSPESAAHLN